MILIEKHEIQTVYFVVDHEDNGRTYQFDSAEEALKWKRELIEDFWTNAENVSVFERKYDQYGNWTSQKYI